MKEQATKLTALFLKHPALIPWFPPVLIGQDYTAAVEFLQQVKPHRIVTNNTGIAFAAWQQAIPWVAGPYLNLTNSYSLLCLKEHFNCAGVFLSNELSKSQLEAIRKPAGFDLYYSLYHPMMLMTSRQCLFHQVEGCEKTVMDEACLTRCARRSTLTNLKQETFHIVKARGQYHHLYDATHFLNTGIVTELPHHFSGFLADLRELPTTTCVEGDKTTLVGLFENLLKGDEDAEESLHRSIHPTTRHPYHKGI
jgi:putative protease